MNEFKIKKLLASNFPYWDKKINKIVWIESKFYRENISFLENFNNYLDYLNQLEHAIFNIFYVVRNNYINYANFRDRLYRHRLKFIRRSHLALIIQKNYLEGNIL